MPPTPDNAQLASDAELITRVRAGDRSAFGDLYARHAGAAAALARQFARSAAEADDLVSEAFARVLDGMLESKGPDTAFRAYLFTTIRNTAYDRTRKDKRLQFTDDMESHDVAVEGDDPVIADLETGLIGKAFAGLPERWQTVLWHTQVEGQSAAEVGILLGMAPNAVSSLAFRAREGLREAYLQAHLAETAAERCRATVDRLGAWTRGSLSKREKAQVDAHLEECDRCPLLAAELSEINGGLRGLLAPLLLGGAAAGYIATLGPVVPLVQLGVMTGGSTAVVGKASVLGGKASLIGSKAIGGIVKIGSMGPGAALAGAAAAAAVLVAGVVITLSSGRSAPPAADRGASVAGAVTSGTGLGALGNGGNGGGGGNGANGGGGNGGGNGGGGNGAGGTGSTDATATGVPSSPTSAISPTSITATNRATGAITGPIDTPDEATPTSTLPIIPGIFDTTSPTPTTPLLPTDSTRPSTTGTAATTPSTTADTTADTTPETTSDTSGSGTAAPGASGTETSSSDTSSPDTSDATPTTQAAATTPTTPATPTTPTTASDIPPPPTTTTPTSTTPPPPAAAHLVISIPQISGVVAGGDATVSLTVTNDGGTASGNDEILSIEVPAGLTLTGQSSAPAAPGLRSTRTAALVSAADTGFSCADSSPISCVMPVVQPGASMTLTVTLSVDVDVSDALGPIQVTLTGQPTTSLPVPTPTVGYASATLAAGAPIASAALDRVTFQALARAGVTRPGTITLGSSQFTVIQAVGDPPDCTIASGAITCPYAAVQAGLELEISVPTRAAGALAFTVTDQKGRVVTPGASVTIDDTVGAIGGYTSVRLDGPGSTLRAGSTTTATLTGTVLNAGVVNPGPISFPIALSDGLSVITADLPGGCAVSGGDQTVICTPVDRAAGDIDPITFVLPLQVSSAATGDQTLPSATLPAGPTSLADAAAPLTVDPDHSGYDSIAVNGTLVAGTMGQLTLSAKPGDGVTQPGPITLSRRLSDGLLVTAAQGCNPSGDTFVCAADQTTDPVLTVAALPTATGTDATVEPATLAGGRTLAIAGGLTINARLPGDGVDLVGPFGGSMVAAQTLYCPTGISRGLCPAVPLGKLTPIDVTRTLTTGTKDVVNAELTWAAGSPADTRDSAGTSLNTVTVTVDGVRATVTGSRPTGIGSDTAGRMFVRAADLMDYPALAAVLRTAGDHQVLVQNLRARTTPSAQISAMAAWSLSAIWVTAGPAADVRVQTGNSGQYLQASNGSAGRATIAPAGSAVQNLWFTVWAPDATATKSLTFAGAPAITLVLTGVEQILGRSTAVGYQVVQPDLSSVPIAARSGTVVFTDRTSAGGGDDLWIGPTLVIRSAD